MFCPNCGANNSTEQKFCRSCGLNLEKTAESLLEQLPTAESANLLKQTKLLEKFGNTAFIGLGTVFLVGISMLVFVIFKRMIDSGDTNKIIFGLFLITFIIFAVFSLAYVIFNESLKEKKKKVNPILQNEIEKKDTAKLLVDKPFEPIPSIVENSTELFPVENKTKKLN